MFERRLRIILALPILCLIAIWTRLFQVQVLHGREYEQKAEEALVCPSQDLPPLRGAIQDRNGRVLVSDEPAVDATVHYGALSMNESYLLLFAERIRKREPDWKGASIDATVAEAGRRIARMWSVLAEASGIKLRDLCKRRDEVCRRVESLRRHVWESRKEKGFDEPLEKVRLREESQFHPILRDLSPQARLRIELELGQFPFVRIDPSVRRVWSDDARPLCHVLGQIGSVSAKQIEDDPLRDNPLACYRCDDDVGVSGVERLAEGMLRGQRGFEEKYLDGSLKDRCAAKDGLDIQLTIDLDLQAQIGQLLDEAVSSHAPSTGASAVVVDVRTREVLAAVSVPTFARKTLREAYESLRDDSIHQPLRFRAVQDCYQPGSIIKPVALLGGFANDLVDPAQRVTCTGALIPGATKWHCWTHWRNMPGHGDLNAEEAIQHSCNVFFYTLGQRLGAQRLTDFYREFVLGPGSGESSERGTGLIEESFGLIPSRLWLQEHRQRNFSEADGRNYAIGQGEIQMTPLQAANMFATLATGVYRDPTIIANDCRPRPARPFPRITANAWELVRRGLDRCVNEEGGTAFKYAHMPQIELCGKTGSAECVPRVAARRYTFEVGDTSGVFARQSVEAPTIEAAREALGLESNARCVDRQVSKRWPLPDPARVELVGTDAPATAKIPTHAWFAGFAPYRQPRIAVAVIIEYGGGGGATAGPVAKSIVQAVLESPHGYVTGNELAAAP